MTNRPLKDPSARTLVAGDFEAVFLPGHGMLGASFRHQGVEILGRVEDLDTAAKIGSTAGIPFLHPWANRLAGLNYSAAGREVTLDRSSSLLHFDDRGLPMHGVPWPLLAWDSTEVRQDLLAARLDWSRGDLLAIFPFRHHLEMAVTLGSGNLTVETTLVAGRDGPVPVSFGFHPYFRISEAPRTEWRLELPPMRKLALDARGIPTGEEESFDGFNAELGESNFDDGFALMKEKVSFHLEGARRRITVEFLRGYLYTQVFAPRDKDYMALEPMTAPTNALTTGHGLRLLEPGREFRAAFRISVDG